MITPEQRRRYNVTRNAVVAFRRASGLCACGKETVEGLSKCQKCRDGWNATQRRLRTKARAAGRCVACKCAPASQGLFCEPCRQSANARTAEFVQRRVDARVCRRCGEVPDGLMKQCLRCRTLSAENRSRIKVEVINRYGGFCACCGETMIGFLTIDHINNDGKERRAEEGIGSAIYVKLRNRPLDPTLRVLCMNCNAGRYWNGGICPHEVEAAQAFGLT